ncbi:MAG TPA: hypothetical protein VGB30_05815 [bacterium]|jgi:hypothetical protein
MAFTQKERDRYKNGSGSGDSNVNDGGYVEENPYIEANEKEAEKLNVAYYGHLQHQREARAKTIVFWTITLIILLGIGPSTVSAEYCPRCGLWRTSNTVAWGAWKWQTAPEDSPWTEWYNSQNPLPKDHRWVTAGGKKNGFFTVANFPFGGTPSWEYPDNLVSRMRELSDRITRGYVLDIPDALNKVHNSEEWDAIILPLTVGTADDAFNWWNDNKRVLNEWADDSSDSPLAENFMAMSEAYVEERLGPVGNEIPLM